jgi:hypothetical protein
VPRNVSLPAPNRASATGDREIRRRQTFGTIRVPRRAVDAETPIA